MRSVVDRIAPIPELLHSAPSRSACCAGAALRGFRANATERLPDEESLE
jgi:hypothetical protein